MPKSKGRKPPARRATVGKRTGPAGPPSFDSIADAIVRGGRELRERDDPFDAETWASGALGMLFKVPIPLQDRGAFESGVRDAIVARAERSASASSLAALRALASMEPDPIATPARQAADLLASRGIAEPSWVSEIGTAVFEIAFMITDAYGDADAYYSTWRYPGREPHMLATTINRNLGGIARDAFAGFPQSDMRALSDADPEIISVDVTAEEMAARVIEAIEVGDLYVDNDWSADFREMRAMVLARMSRLPRVALPHPEPLGEDEREVLIKGFLDSLPPGIDAEPAAEIAHLCLRYSCDYAVGGDPFRWSPTEVASFLVDWLPRKAMVPLSEIRAMPEVLPVWLRFALTRRGLTEDLIAETQEAVARWMPQFRAAVTDPGNFGPAKAMSSAIMAAGIDITDADAVDRWIAEFNARPFEERDAFLGPTLDA